MAGYRIWTTLRKPGICYLDVLEGFDAPWNLKRGKSLKDEFPTGVRFHMSPSAPKDIKLADALDNSKRAIVISKTFSDFLQRKEVPAVEYLPVSIVNHKGRVASDDYFILNVLAIQDSLNLEKSRPVYNKIDKTSINAVAKVVLHETKIDPTLPIFRLKDFPSLLLVESSLADTMMAEGFTNVEFAPLDEYEP